MGNYLTLFFVFTCLAVSNCRLSANSELIRCRVCFGKVSVNASACPHCGEPNFKPAYRVIEKEALQDRAGVFYAVNDTKPYEGWAVDGRYVNGRPKIEQEYRDGKKWGFRKKWYENGQLMQRSQFDNGVLHGNMVEWHDNGVLMAEGAFKEGQLDGIVRRWYANGKKEAEYPYKNGKLEGILYQWSRRGNMIAKKKYEDGKVVARLAVDSPITIEDDTEEGAKPEPTGNPPSNEQNVFEGLQLGFPDLESAK